MSYTPDASDHQFMARAVQLARRGLYTAHPNPRVGCVLVKHGQVVGEGFHERAGEPHAEIKALNEAHGEAKGAIAYATLEPCCHHGRTRPCTQALIDAGIERVVAAMQDPNPRVAGRGFAALRAAGIDTHCGVMQGEAERLNQGFISRMRRNRPWVRVKLAASLDGRTALANGESRWISGEPSRRDVQYFRARSGAIMTGAGTVRADDPALTVRLSAAELQISEPPPQPLRVILSASLNIDPQAHVLKGAGPCLIFTGADAECRVSRLSGSNVEVIRMPSGSSQLDLHEVVQNLAAREINEVQVEAGVRLSGALLREDLVDELFIYMAPVVMGDAARGMFQLPIVERMADRLALRIDDVRMIGEDLRLVAMPSNAIS